MMKKTHLALGLMATIASQPNASQPTMLALLSGAFIGSLLPDWDLHWHIPHRTITHWYIWPILALVICPGSLAFGLALGWGLHILADSMTVDGVRPFWPLRWRVHGPAKTGTLSEYAIAVPVLVWLGWLIWVRR